MWTNDKTRLNKRIALAVLTVVAATSFLFKEQLPFQSNKVVASGIVEDIDNKKDNHNLNTSNKNDVNNMDNENQLNSVINKTPVENPEDLLVLVNKKRYLDSKYKPDDLIIPDVRFSFDGNNEKKQMRYEAALALEELFNAANKSEIYLYAVSGYRSYNTQERIFNNKASQVGEEEANKISARPGESEHQTGLAMDVSCHSVKYDLVEEFGDTIEGIWVRDNAHRFGFIIRYLKEKTDITGYSYEPWHLRYVGKDVAEDIYNKGITLEEYLEIQ